MKRGKAYFLKERLKEYAKNKDYGFLLYIVDTIRIIFMGLMKMTVMEKNYFLKKKEAVYLLFIIIEKSIHTYLMADLKII